MLKSDLKKADLFKKAYVDEGQVVKRATYSN
jgi:hypothetical protein